MVGTITTRTTTKESDKIISYLKTEMTLIRWKIDTPNHETLTLTLNKYHFQL